MAMWSHELYPGRRLDACDDADDPEDADEYSKQSNYTVGIIMSVVADCIIAISLNVQKLAHNRNRGEDGQPKKLYLKIPLWWAGLLLNVVGELGNMLAYGYAPAAIVAPVGSVGLLCNELIAVLFLGEKFRYRDVFALVGIVGGVVLIIFGVPANDEELTTYTLINDYYTAPVAYSYIIFLCLAILFWVAYVEPRYAHKHVLVWLFLCSVISSITVISCRGFSTLLTKIPEDCEGPHCIHGKEKGACSQTVGHWLFWLMLFVIVVTAIWSAMYLNRAMMVFGNTQVVPVYYVTFTLFSIVGGAIVYKELAAITYAQMGMFGGGCICAALGVWLVSSGHTPGDDVRDSKGTEKSSDSDKKYEEKTTEEKAETLMVEASSGRTAQLCGGFAGALQWGVADKIHSGDGEVSKMVTNAHRRGWADNKSRWQLAHLEARRISLQRAAENMESGASEKRTGRLSVADIAMAGRRASAAVVPYDGDDIESWHGSLGSSLQAKLRELKAKFGGTSLEEVKVMIRASDADGPVTHTLVSSGAAGSWLHEESGRRAKSSSLSPARAAPAERRNLVEKEMECEATACCSASAAINEQYDEPQALAEESASASRMEGDATGGSRPSGDDAD